MSLILKSLTHILTIFLILSINAFSAVSQSKTPLKTTSKSLKDSTSLQNVPDSIRVKRDSTLIVKDSTKNKGGLQAEVSIIARDSQRTEVDKNISHLYKGAKVKYQDFELSADYIRLDRNKKQIFASGVIDHNGKYVGRPIVISGAESPKTVDSLVYDYEKQEGNTYGIMTDVDGGFIQAKVVRKNMYDEMSLYHGLYSTCNLPEPHTHFGIFLTKGIVTKNQIIAGPSYLVVQNVPLKFIGFPFAFFPKPDKRSSGFLFPSFGEDYTRGFAMRDIGWYLAFNDYWDSEVRGTLYSKGSWEASINTRYTVNYKYNGGFNIRYASTKAGVEGTDNYGTNKDFNVTWNHTQRQEANPGTSFSANVNFGTGSYFRNTGANGTNTYNDITKNNMSSSISYGRVFADGKINFTSSLSHRQDMSTGNVYLQLPNFSLNVSSFNPFDSKDRAGEQKWYQRINVGYSLQGTNTLNTGDSTLFSKQTLKQFTNGFQHNIPISLSLNAFEYFQFNTSVNYTERWYLQSTRQRMENTKEGYIPVKDTIQGFRRAYDYSVSSGLSTKIYGMYPKIGNIQAIRHIITPSINLNYRPDFSDATYGFYKNYVDQYGMINRYSIFQDNVYGSPSAGKSMGIGFSVDNNIEAKIKSKSDTTDGGFKKVPLIQGLSISGNYNFVADSMKLSPLTFSGRTALFKEKVNINFNGTLDPYAINQAGQRYNKYVINEGKLARLTSFGFSFDYSFNPKAAQNRNNNIDSLRNQIGSNMTPEQAQALSRISSDPNAFVNFNIPWNLAGSFSFQYSKPGLESTITSTINIHGDFSLTPKWKVTFNSGYDLKAKEITLTQFNIYRDLHCWDMAFGWTPFGRYQSYNVTIRAKSSILQDLKLSKRNSSGGSYY
ncbi:LPS-assembly protein LptD [Sphingobacterium sp. SRCM116780]|uniref:putative LPS assembly protein LptD n=1 Tax=Sphingobacterium sp. SRCM116780 TaxID=2907623 RepID=UPI001F22A186|nr:putative LPS assembly protein LptD [Sphingobacterium sp. SRCM116780]UIR56442.1 LPS-assembly protein LptD [Sphingobacterium sp. SRCM116780]